MLCSLFEWHNTEISLSGFNLRRSGQCRRKSYTVINQYPLFIRYCFCIIVNSFLDYGITWYAKIARRGPGVPGEKCGFPREVVPAAEQSTSLYKGWWCRDDPGSQLLRVCPMVIFMYDLNQGHSHSIVASFDTTYQSREVQNQKTYWSEDFLE